ncbi:MAG: ferric reductase-like transmembrane domain-containing protein [Candidatus Woykebacteria bacterium]
MFEAFARNSSVVHLFTNALYLVLVGVVLVTAYSIYNDQEIYNFFAVKRAWFGRAALSVLLVVITPGIIGRLGIEFKISRIITLYRRRLGILVFLLAFTHYHLVTLPKLAGIEPIMIPLFQIFGSSALMILFFMFATSNNFSVRRLGKWWKPLHRLVYVALLLILFHTALQRISIWSILAGVFLVLELASFAYAYIKGGSLFNEASARTS